MLELVEAGTIATLKHIDRKDNPHEVTKAQVGLGNVDNTSDLDKPLSNATKSAINTLTTNTNNMINQVNENIGVIVGQLNSNIGTITNELNKQILGTHSAIETFKKENQEEHKKINSAILTHKMEVYREYMDLRQRNDEDHEKIRLETFSAVFTFWNNASSAIETFKEESQDNFQRIDTKLNNLDFISKQAGLITAVQTFAVTDINGEVGQIEKSELYRLPEIRVDNLDTFIIEGNYSVYIQHGTDLANKIDSLIGYGFNGIQGTFKLEISRGLLGATYDYMQKLIVINPTMPFVFFRTRTPETVDALTGGTTPAKWSDWQKATSNIMTVANEGAVEQAVNVLSYTAQGEPISVPLNDVLAGSHIHATETDARDITYVMVNTLKTDINSLIKSGMYKCYRWLNYPAEAGYDGQGYLCNYNWNEATDGYGDKAWGYQTYINPNGVIWKRYRSGSKFGSWKLIEQIDGSIPVISGGTGHTVGSLPFSGKIHPMITATQDFTLPNMAVGDMVPIVLKPNGSTPINQRYTNNGTYLLQWSRWMNNTNTLHDNNTQIKVVTPSTNISQWTYSAYGICDVIRIK